VKSVGPSIPAPPEDRADKFRLVYLNARSLISNARRLSFDFEITHQFDFPEIIVVTETWLNDNIPTSLFNCSKFYNVYRLDRQNERLGGGGVAVFVKNTIRSYEIAVPNIGALEALLVAVVVDKQKLFIGSVYKPNVADVHLLEPLKLFVDYTTSKRGRHLILGDFNLPGVDWETLSSSNYGKQRQFMRIFTKRGYKQMVGTPTRGDNILDLVFADDSTLVSSLKVCGPFSTSDHCVISTELNFGIKECAKFRTCWHSGSYIELCDCLLVCDWQMLFAACTSVDDVYDQFVGICRELISMFIPCKRVKNGVPHSCAAVRKALNHKLRCHQIHRRERSELSLETFKAATESVTKTILAQNLQYEKSLIAGTDIRKFYGYVNSKIRANHNHSVIMENGEPISDSRKSDLFNNQFCSVFVADNGVPGILPDKNTRSTLRDAFFTDERVAAALNKLNCKTSFGDDGLPPIFFKKCSSVFVEPLKLIFQRSFETSELPAAWRDAVIVPIYKNKGNRSEVGNYRPISLTSVACRLMESVLKFHLVNHLLENDLISRSQHGFMANRSTNSNLLGCLNDWCRAVDKRECIDVLYIDIAKAFDSVSHPKLLYKLTKYGVGGKFFEWIRAFLGNRRQKVRINSNHSDYVRVSSGVPQGSVLGPVLFLIYINDLAEVVKNCSISIFADDSKIYFEVNRTLDVDRMQADIDRVLLWCQAWQLEIAAHKCNILHIGRGSLGHTYSMGQTEISTVDSVKDLGVTISADLRFSLHVANITKQAFQRLNLIFRTFCSRDVDCLVKAYITYVRPLLEYDTVVWSPFLLGDISSIEKVQRHFTRRLRGMDGFSYLERLDRLGLETLEERRIRFDLVEAFRIIKGISVLRFDDFFQFKNDGRTRGHQLQLRMRIVPRLEVYRNFFANRVINMWNQLPDDAVNAVTVTQFKARISGEFLRRHRTQQLF
jgi:hypothetical protein